ncbi:Fe-S cluster assembly protein SufD [Leptospira kirschneri]|uniref:Fe-S cluster assembly protein SufD n=1 Tax=Leptospira kirschneri TaxID=29507 RepID=UPI0002BECC0E|nr:Fe-S cluster assembly protein SufD [Leptospira kirschneri]EMJ94702.1 FeS assembly protein SufD [Leptospira kirschneri str. JB]KON78730.1 FeS assembly protein SufD [Leptospira kirschneri serovar Mozdok]KPZ77213.1 ABC transporter permease [Leptospira kirschneri serovar Mozdok]NDK06941.1 FeS assembly protein SufD [Leptospira kirschneri serovar Mozdok]
MTGSLQNQKTETKLSLENLFEKFVSQSKESQALKDFRKKVFAKFQTLKIPGSENESWRKIPLSNFHPEEFTEVPDSAAVSWKIPDSVKLQRSETLSGKELENFLNILEGIFQKQNEEWFTLYSLANFTHGLYLEIGNDFIFQEEIEIKFRLEKEDKILPLIVAKIGNHNKILIVERYECAEEQELKFFQGLSVLQIGAGSKVSYVGIESFGSSIFHFQNLFSDQKENSDVKIAKVTPGGYKGKNLLNVDLSGKGAKARVIGLAPMAAREFQDSEVKIVHNESHTESSILYRSALKNKAHHIFTGNLQIPNSCKDVNAIQINNNLLLNRTSRAESIPKLEVYAENVKCEHGATVGEIDEEQLFYLASRGIDEDEARRMIVDGFLGQVIGEIESNSIQEELFQLIAKKVEGAYELS